MKLHNPFARCKHEWKILSDHVFESRYERAIRLGYEPTSISSVDLEKKHEVIVTCTQCGAIKEYNTIV